MQPQPSALLGHVHAKGIFQGRNHRLCWYAQVSERLTGFVHNAVSPVGMATPEMPVVLSHRIQALGGGDGAGFMWFGGGEPDLKLGMPVAAFVRAYSPFVCDCTYDGASEGAEDVNEDV